METLLSPSLWIGLLTLIFLEIVLGIDNIIFISIVVNKLPAEKRTNARRLGLLLALALRVFMLLSITWIIQFNAPIVSISSFNFSIRDLILCFGGVFLIYKSTTEINQATENVEENKEENEHEPKSVSVAGIILQIVLIDFIFSFDSILTAVGLSKYVAIMIAAVIISIGLMMFFLEKVGNFMKQHQSMEILALGFLILIGFILILESFHYEVPKAYIYFAVAFSFSIELMNLRKKRRKPNNAKLVSKSEAIAGSTGFKKLNPAREPKGELVL